MALYAASSFQISDICLHDPSLSIQFHKAHYLPASTRVVAEDDATNASTVIAMKKIGTDKRF